MTEILKIENNQLEKFEDFAEELIWLENFTSVDTKKTYSAAIKKFCNILSISSFDELRKVDNIHIIKFRDQLREKGESNATINNRLSALSSLYKFLIEKQVVKKNPVYGVKAMKKNYRKVKSRIMNDGEVKAMLNEPNEETLIGLRDKAILSIIFNLGPRRGTIVKLTGKDIFEENGYMVFDMYLKGDKRNRVAVNSHVQANLRKYFEAIGYYKSLPNGEIKFEIPKDAPIFPNLSNNPDLRNPNKPMTDTAIYQMWQKYANKLGIERTSPHCARSTFITKALASGCDLQHTQHTVGHSDPRTTMSYNLNETDYKNSASFSVSFG
jgi:site-specific recombinase XerD